MEKMNICYKQEAPKGPDLRSHLRPPPSASAGDSVRSLLKIQAERQALSLYNIKC